MFWNYSPYHCNWQLSDWKFNLWNSSKHNCLLHPCPLAVLEFFAVSCCPPLKVHMHSEGEKSPRTLPPLFHAFSQPQLFWAGPNEYHQNSFNNTEKSLTSSTFLAAYRPWIRTWPRNKSARHKTEPSSTWKHRIRSTCRPRIFSFSCLRFP